MLTAVVAALLALGALLWLTGLARAAGFALAGYGAYRAGRSAARSARERVVTSEAGVDHFAPDGAHVSFLWQEITHAGVGHEAGGARQLYVYDAASDRLLVVPEWYRGFDALREEIRAHAPFADIQLVEHERISDRLRHITR